MQSFFHTFMLLPFLFVKFWRAYYFFLHMMHAEALQVLKVIEVENWFVFVWIVIVLSSKRKNECLVIEYIEPLYNIVNKKRNNIRLLHIVGGWASTTHQQCWGNHMKVLHLHLLAVVSCSKLFVREGLK